ncbi:MAG: 5-histidylcysteine sulfoxide synthase [Sulfuricurvum sp.]
MNASLYSPTLNGDNIEAKRAEIKSFFNNTYELFEKVFELLKDDSVFYKKSEPTRHPMIFYFGHTATFYINKLIAMKIIDKRINAEFESIFAVGVDEMSWDDLESSNYKWPSVQSVREYRSEVKRVVNELIDTMPLTLPITWEDPAWIVLMGCEHERIHIETSLVLHRQMPLELVKDVEEFKICSHDSTPPANSLIEVDGGVVKLGKDHSHHLYGWDNEYGSYSESLLSFKASKYLVSNAEFMEFVKSGGYEKKEFWDDEGREFLSSSGAKHPPFWVKSGDGFKLRTLSKLVDLPLSHPVEVNALEAEAFCRYKSQKDGITYRLPSETEHMLMLERSGFLDVPHLHNSRLNANFYHYFSSSPIDEFGFGEFYDLLGNVWQWSRTPIFALDGFKTHPAYDDFTTPTFDNKHSLILGSSWASSGNLIHKHSRYAFRKHFYQFAGFRYAVSENLSEIKASYYENDEAISRYIEFGYGDEYFGVKNFACEMARIAVSFADRSSKALDIGCLAGRSTLELARYFDEVEGVDYSARLIGVGTRFLEQKKLEYTIKTEGDLVESRSLDLSEFGYEDLSKRVSFWQGDACNLKPNFHSYDLVMASNLIDRLYDPFLFIDEIKKRINTGGVLIISSPYSHQENSTKKELWLGGFMRNGKEVIALETLKSLLEDEFELLHTGDLEFVIRESLREFKHGISEVSVWKKRS